MSHNDDTESCSASSIGLPPLHLGKPRIPHSQSWTLVDKYNMEMRQQLEVDPFSNWKYDVQCQIANMSNQIKKTFEDYPELKPGRNVPLSNSPVVAQQRSEDNVRQPTYKAPEYTNSILVQRLAVKDVVR
ncbi:hypothetical protein BSL78_27538 [Apostichopus japonicus]|uniref:Uncharacterized protein n=1 Tax=Stichopus japonicus TaxID=307972 RepID=A0A2G8JIQ7_STIJA|nr:hypothetical protein BSL78_27538 [Apostichopus japonicus]